MAASAILLVDDDRDTCASLSDIISDLGYRVGVDYDGPAALDQSRRPPPYGLAVLDSKLPGMDGVELYGHLRHARADTVGVPGGARSEGRHRPGGRPGRHPAGPAQAGGLRPPDPTHRGSNWSPLRLGPGRGRA